MRCFGLSVAILLALALLGPASARAGDTIELFNGKDLSGWRIWLSDPNADPSETFYVKDGVIHDKGTPAGYLITEDEFDNYVLELEWRFPGQGGNSGVFVHVVGDDMIWPKGVEAQLQSGAAGDFWLVGGAQLDVDPARQDKGTPRHYYRMKTDQEVEKLLGEWNHYKITCKGDTIELVVNGQLVNKGTNSELTRGRILLQAEGTPIEFRNITLTPLE